MGRLWSYLSEPARVLFNVLADAALADSRTRFTPAQLVEDTKNPKGASGVAGVLGAAGRAIKKADLPQYEYEPGKIWHFIWDWDGIHYWMPPEVAKTLLRARHGLEP